MKNRNNGVIFHCLIRDVKEIKIVENIIRDSEKHDLLHYKEYGPEDAPSLSTLFNDGRYENQDRIIDYLKKGTVTVVATRYDKDVFSGETILPLQTSCHLTDGEYIWSSDLAYYVEKYNVRLPKEVENRMLAKGKESN